MDADRSSVWWFLILGCGGIVQIVELPPIPAWLNNGLFLSSIALIGLAVSMLVILRINQREDIKFVSYIVKNQYAILIVFAAGFFVAGAVIFPSNHEDLTNHTSSTVIEKGTSPEKKFIPHQTPSQEASVETGEMPDTRVFTPRTPKELMDMVATQTKRDAMHHKDAWIRVVGTVSDISEVKEFGYRGIPYIEVTVEIDLKTKNQRPQWVTLDFDAERWKSHIDKIERGDRLTADGTVYNVYDIMLRLRNAEIISVSGPDGNKR